MHGPGLVLYFQRRTIPCTRFLKVVFALELQAERVENEQAYRGLLQRLAVSKDSRWTTTRPQVESEGTPEELKLSPEDREAVFRAVVADLQVRGGGGKGT